MKVGACVLLMIGFAWFVATAQAGVVVTNVVVQQRWPWNGLVDIDYEVQFDIPDADIYVYPVATDHDTNLSISPRTLTGEGATGPVKAGKRRMTWNMTADQPTLHSSALSVTISAFSGAAPYLVVDLSGGTNALSYPVTYTNKQPDLADDRCRTTNLWLRLVLPGSFSMGSPTDELGRGTNETPHMVVLTQPFYIGVFELTQCQWKLVTGANPSAFPGDVRPVESVSYDMIRGTINGAAWPVNGQVDGNSFLNKLREKTQIVFDLPTEAQWEYACRAGTSTALNSGSNLTNVTTDASMAEVGRYRGYADADIEGIFTEHIKVGSYRPNAWGLYDMHGNVWEWCLDIYGMYQGDESDPKGASTGYERSRRGGGWSSSSAQTCRSASRDNSAASSFRDNRGLRLVALPSVQ